MADFCLDNNIAARVEVVLGIRGHLVVSARQIAMRRAKDSEHLLTAAQNRWIFLTHDREDFELLHDAWLRWSAAWHVGASHAGVRVIPQSSPLTHDQLADGIDAFVAQRPPLFNELYWWRVTNRATEWLRWRLDDRWHHWP